MTRPPPRPRTGKGRSPRTNPCPLRRAEGPSHAAVFLCQTIVPPWGPTAPPRWSWPWAACRCPSCNLPTPVQVRDAGVSDHQRFGRPSRGGQGQLRLQRRGFGLSLLSSQAGASSTGASHTWCCRSPQEAGRPALLFLPEQTPRPRALSWEWAQFPPITPRHSRLVCMKLLLPRVHARQRFAAGLGS